MAGMHRNCRRKQREIRNKVFAATVVNILQNTGLWPCFCFMLRYYMNHFVILFLEPNLNKSSLVGIRPTTLNILLHGVEFWLV